MNIKQFLKYKYVFIYILDIWSSISLLEKNLEKIEELKNKK